MKHFLDELGEELAHVAGSGEAQATPAREWVVRPARLATRGRTAAVATILTSAGAAAATVALLTAGPGTTLPIFSTPVANAAIPAVQASFDSTRLAALDFAHGRAVTTAIGTTYVVQSKAGDETCVALPDPASPGAFGSTCRPTQEVRRRGLVVLSVGSKAVDRSAKTTAVLITPAGEVTARLERDGDDPTSVPVADGVAVVQVETAAVLHWQTESGPQLQDLPAPFSAGRGRTLMCPDGSLQELDDRAGAHEAVVDGFRQLRRYCP